MPGPEDDLALLTEAALEAGKIATRFFRNDPQTWDKGNDDPVTEADLAVDRMLREELRAARPDYGWLSEETEDSAERLAHDRVFIVDPIDGTRSFVEGSTGWGHSLAVVEKGRPVAGVVYLPAQDKLFVAAMGTGARLNGETLRASAAATPETAEVLTTRPSLRPEHWPGGVPEVKRAYRPSLAYRIAAVATGRFDGMITFRKTWEWDIAAGILIASEAGARVTDASGAALVLNNPHPQVDGVLAAGPDLHRALMRHRTGRS